MTRHSKNATAGPTYTYHEKQKDSKLSGYGTIDQRLNKDSIKDFDCCSLSLQPCKNPVITQDGYLFDKEVILEYILHQKKENIKKMKQYEKNLKEEQSNSLTSDALLQKEKLEKFLKSEGKLAASTSNEAASSSNSTELKGAKSSNFWIPSQSSQAKSSGLSKKPDNKVYCPMSGKPLTIRDLYDVKFKLLDENDKGSLVAKKERYVCAVTNDILTNAVPCCVLKPSGAVVTQECVEKIIKKEKEWTDPINGAKLTESDIIPIDRGGTGFAGSGAQLTSKTYKPAMIS